MTIWLQKALGAGRLTALDVTRPLSTYAPAAGNPSSGNRTAHIGSGLDFGTTRGTAGPAPGNLPVVDRFIEVAYRAELSLVKKSGLSLGDSLTLSTLQRIARALTLLGSAHKIGRPVIFDKELMAACFATVGWQGFDALRNLAACITRTLDAKSNGDLDEAAGALSMTISMLGPIPFVALMTHRGRSALSESFSAEAVLARWASYIAALQLSFDGMQGALWAKLGAGGEELATGLASREGRVTLGMVLQSTDFQRRYQIEFGSSQSAVTKRVWEMISQHFAQKLRGSVTVYIDQSRAAKDISLSGARPYKPMPIPDLLGATPAKVDDYETNQALLPVLGVELDALLSLRNAYITQVRFVDIRDPAKHFTLSQFDIQRIRQNEAGTGPGARQ